MRYTELTWPRHGTRRGTAGLRPGLLGLAVGVALLLTACSGGGSDGDRVTVQLDWTPNTNHIGIYVAQAQGWYREAGVRVEILPYNDVNPDTVVANGRADVGVSFPPNLIFSRAAGLDLVSIAMVLQRGVTELAVLDASELRRPRDFDGKVYAGFGLPYEEPQIRTVIRADGGRGEFQTATLTTHAYEALYNRRADFTEIFVTWEGIEADLRGIKLRTFRYDDYGVPDIGTVVLVARAEAVTRRAETLRRFLQATRRGYEFAARQPQEASRIFLDALPRGTFPEPQMVTRSSAMLAPIFVDSAGRWGHHDAARWQAYSGWLLAQGVVKDSRDRVLGQLPGGPLFTNDLLDGH